MIIHGLKLGPGRIFILSMQDPAKVLELGFPIRDRANGGLVLVYLPCLEEGGEALKWQNC
jgi:hypothetical protein